MMRQIIVFILSFFIGSIFNVSYGEFYDPMKPSPSSMVVNAIYLSAQKRVAIINEVRYSEKEYVNGWLVDKIDHDEVILRNNGEIIRLLLAQSFFKDE